ncbi:MAG: bacteriohemerythrin [Syntrophales bacterium]|nr:bacteriohemerythrin [Syntrophales bacterium]
MPLIKWDNSFSVNVAEIDGQHQKLVSLINSLDDAMRQGRGKEVLDKTIAELINYAATHFQTEEKYFEQFGYPEKDEHKREHGYFVQKVSAFKKEMDERRLGLTIEVMNFLSHWLTNHIKGTDKKYSQFFNEKGLK